MDICLSHMDVQANTAFVFAAPFGAVFWNRIRASTDHDMLPTSVSYTDTEAGGSSAYSTESLSRAACCLAFNWSSLSIRRATI